jgi:alkaline phosphatase D
MNQSPRVVESSRRRFLQQSALAVGGALLGGAGVSGEIGSSRAPAAGFAAPALLVPEEERPAAPYGVAAGDVTAGRAVIWSRADRPARMIVEYATTDKFADPRRRVGPAALPETGLTARVDLDELPPGQRIFYRVRFQDLRDLRRVSEPVSASFVSPPADRRTVSFAWSADCCGQGWGINEEWGGLRLFETMRRAGPDLFLHLGDTVYADQPLQPEVPLEDGRVWRNLVTPAKAKVAETLDEFRGNHLYTLLDVHARRFNAEVAQAVTWDDHEVRDNWYATRSLERDPRYTEKAMALLAARAGRAFLEHYPIRIDGGDPERIYRVLHWGPLADVFVLDLRSCRGPNTDGRQAAEGEATRVLGSRQRAWLKEALRTSRATWKILLCSVPIGLVVPDLPLTDVFEGFANGEPGAPLGRELEIADLLRFLQEARIANVVWLTADVHYAAAHRYDPARARFTRFDPFWEFVAGPLHAGTFGPNALDPTFGPEVRFLGIPPGMKPNRPPSDGLQFFGMVRIDGASEVMRVGLHDLSGKELWAVELEPRRA